MSQGSSFGSSGRGNVGQTGAGGGQFGTPTRGTAEEATSLTERAKDAASSVTERAKDLASSAAQQAGDIGSSVAQRAQNVASSVADTAGDYAATVGHRAEDLAEDVTTWIRRYPVQSLLIGFGAGFLLARALRG